MHELREAPGLQIYDSLSWVLNFHQVHRCVCFLGLLLLFQLRHRLSKDKAVKRRHPQPI